MKVNSLESRHTGTYVVLVSHKPLIDGTLSAPLGVPSELKVYGRIGKNVRGSFRLLERAYCCNLCHITLSAVSEWGRALRVAESVVDTADRAWTDNPWPTGRGSVLSNNANLMCEKKLIRNAWPSRQSATHSSAPRCQSLFGLTTALTAAMRAANATPHHKLQVIPTRPLADVARWRF